MGVIVYGDYFCRDYASEDYVCDKFQIENFFKFIQFNPDENKFTIV